MPLKSPTTKAEKKKRNKERKKEYARMSVVGPPVNKLSKSTLTVAQSFRGELGGLIIKQNVCQVHPYAKRKQHELLTANTLTQAHTLILARPPVSAKQTAHLSRPNTRNTPFAPHVSFVLSSNSSKITFQGGGVKRQKKNAAT